MKTATGLIDSTAAAEMLGITEQTLRSWRSSQRDQPVYHKLNGRVRYKPRDIESWIAKHAVSH
jgi:DNA-binding transcriptional MerR regulator